MKDAACQVDDNLQLQLTLSEGISDMFYKTQPLPRIDKKSKNLSKNLSKIITNNRFNIQIKSYKNNKVWKNKKI